ncbi:fluoride efflux transporter FluC [Brachybacterium sp. AOP25-B2-12]|uniref:fluoride efflux transporter FluC n=1 Tax=Brachybacterium sp. AOP25-B2-12 TaxID=3457710 RepID=UPI0040347995
MMALAAVLAVAVGGALGALGRWGLIELSVRLRGRPTTPSIPWPTLVAHVIGCFLLGIVAALVGSSSSRLGDLLYLLFAVGLAGSLSVMSTGALEVVDLVRRGAPVIALGYVLVAAGAGMAALWLGLVLAT